MAIMCTVCGEWVERPELAPGSTRGRDTLDICEGCLPNFAGAQPPLDWAAQQVSETVTLTPRQVQALARMHRRWQEDTPC